MSQHHQPHNQAGYPNQGYPVPPTQPNTPGSNNVLWIILGAVGVAFVLLFVGCVAVVASLPVETTQTQQADTEDTPVDSVVSQEPVETTQTPPPTEEPAGTTSEQASFFQPAMNVGADPAEPFWTTVFELAIPAGAWEPLEIDPTLCKPVDEEKYELTNDSGTRIAAFDQEPRITFGRTTSTIDGDTCIVDAIVLGDYVDDLGNSYTVSNGKLSATFTPQEFFLGQSTASGMPDDGRGRKPLTP